MIISRDPHWKYGNQLTLTAPNPVALWFAVEPFAGDHKHNCCVKVNNNREYAVFVTGDVDPTVRYRLQYKECYTAIDYVLSIPISDPTE